MSDDLTDVTGERFPLAEALQTLRRELRVAMQDADPDLPLEVKEARVSLEVSFTRSAGVGGALQAWVVGIEASGGRETGHSHTLQLTLTPRTRAGGPVQVGADGDDAGAFGS